MGFLDFLGSGLGLGDDSAGNLDFLGDQAANILGSNLSLSGPDGGVDLLQLGEQESGSPLETSVTSLLGGRGPGPDPLLGEAQLALNAPTEQGLGGKIGSGIGDFASQVGDFLTPKGGFTLESLLGTVGKAAGTGAGLLNIVNAAKAGSQASRAQGQVNAARQSVFNTARPASESAAALIPAGTTAVLGGPLPPGLQAEADFFRSDALQRLNGTFAHLGITDSTMMQSLRNQVEQQYIILKERLGSQLLSSGGTLLTQSAQPLIGVAQNAQTQTSEADRAISASTEALATLLGSQPDKRDTNA